MLCCALNACFAGVAYFNMRVEGLEPESFKVVPSVEEHLVHSLHKLLLGQQVWQPAIMIGFPAKCQDEYGSTSSYINMMLKYLLPLIDQLPFTITTYLTLA